MKHNIRQYIYLTALAAVTGFSSCEKFLENAKLPAGTIAGDDAFVSDNSTGSIVTGTFINLASNSLHSTAAITSLYTDDLAPLPGTTANMPNWNSYRNQLPLTTNYWSTPYARLYEVNTTIEGIQKTPYTLYFKNQWLGESYFTRAYLFYSLTNMYGDIVLPVTSDYTVNNKLPRTPQSEVYKQIVSDLLQARTLLGSNYANGNGVSTNDRARPNRAAADALLAKAYLTMKEWDKAEAHADSVIRQTSLYELVKPADVFLTNSKETIWALAQRNNDRTQEFLWYFNNMPATIATDPATTYSVMVHLSDDLEAQFEPNDARWTNWVRTSIYTGVTPAITYAYPHKYKSGSQGAERPVILRLGDIQLVRAEARAQLNKLAEARADIDTVRGRAALPKTTATTQTAILAAIAHERRVELFTECNNRFFDLKRTGKIDAVIEVMAPLKGGTWESWKAVFPIPPADITNNPNIKPNEGYQ